MESMSLAEMYVPGDIRWGLGGKTDEKFGFMPKGHGSLAMWGIRSMTGYRGAGLWPSP
jgi:acetyl-CoA C-acetyltransferase